MEQEFCSGSFGGNVDIGRRTCLHCGLNLLSRESATCHVMWPICHSYMCWMFWPCSAFLARKCTESILEVHLLMFTPVLATLETTLPRIHFWLVSQEVRGAEGRWQLFSVPPPQGGALCSDEEGVPLGVPGWPCSLFFHCPSLLSNCWSRMWASTWLWTWNAWCFPPTNPHYFHIPTPKYTHVHVILKVR